MFYSLLILFTGFSFAIRQDFQSTQATIITMTHAVTFIRNGDIPMDNILLMIRFFIFQNLSLIHI